MDIADAFRNSKFKFVASRFYRYLILDIFRRSDDYFVLV